MSHQQPSLCSACAGLELWPGIFNSRYLCGLRLGENIKAFSRFGRPCHKGVPQVTACAKYQYGRHYSMKPR